MTSHQLVRPEDISALPAAERGQIITKALEESKSWLAVATQGTDPTPIAEFKAWAATVAEMTRQKGLAEEIQLDALEMVRRAERGIGVAIRNGQRTGEITRIGEHAGNQHASGRSVDSNSSKPRPTDFASAAELSGNEAGIYHMTDGISDEQFDDAVDDARAEQNLARANVVRKVRGATAPMTRAQKAEKIREMAGEGYTSRQMSGPLGMTGTRGDETVRDIARDHGIDIPADRFTARTKGRDIEPVRVVQGTLDAINGIEYGINQLASADYDAFTLDQVHAWVEALDTPMRALRALQKELKTRDR